MRSTSIRVLAPALLCLAPLGCPSEQRINDEVHADYTEGRVSVIGSDSSGAPVSGSAPAPGDGCVLAGQDCVAAAPDGEWCEREGGPYDVVVVDGEVVEVICYPPPTDSEGPELVVADPAQGDLEVPQDASNTAITFDESTDGTPIEGNFTLDGNNVSVYGNGPDKTIIDGDIVIEGNNVRLRGVTVMGNVVVRLNNAAIVLSRIHGDLVLDAESTNGSVIAANEVFGRIDVPSNNNTIVSNLVQGDFDITGNNNTCNENQAFADANEDEVIADTELGDPLTCEAP